MPYIEEQSFGDENRLKEFAYDQLKRGNSTPTGSRRTVPAMRHLELKEYESHSENVPLDKDQLRALADAPIEVTPSPDADGAYRLKTSSYIGALNIGDLAVVIRPQDSHRPGNVSDRLRDGPEGLAQARISSWRKPRDVLEAIALAFAHRTRQAIQRGLLQGYRREEDALHTVRGRVRFGDQISRRFGIPLPIEVAFDEFTEDIEKNRLLKTAIHRLGHTYIRSDGVRREVRSLRPAFAMVGLGSYRPGPSAGGPVHPSRRALPAGSGAGPPHNPEHQPGAFSRQGRRRRVSHRYEQGIRGIPLRCAGRGARPTRTRLATRDTSSIGRR